MMEWCVNFPKEQVIMARPSLRKACGGNRNAGKLLGYFLYRVSARENAKLEAERINELRRQQGQKPDQDTSTSICRTQSQIVEEMDEELSERTLRDDAIPCLKELHYITTEEIRGNRQFTIFTVNLNAIQEAILHPENVANFQTLPYFLALNGKRKKSWLRIRNNSARKQFRSETLPDGSETIPNGSEMLPDAQAQGLGNNSAPENGLEEPVEASSEGDFEPAKNREKSNYKNTLQEEGGAFASAHAALAEDLETFENEPLEDDPDATIKAPTPASLQAVNGATHDHTTHPHSSVPDSGDAGGTDGISTPAMARRTAGQVDAAPQGQASPHIEQTTSARSLPPDEHTGGATTRVKAGESRPPDEEPKETAKQKKARIEKRKSEIIALYCDLLGRKKIVLSKDNLEGAKQMAEAESSDEEITRTYNRYKNDKFWGPQLTLKIIAKLLDTTVTSGNGASVPAKPKARPTEEDKNISIFEVDKQFRVWQRKGDDQEWIWWEGEFWTPEEADERGYNGGFGLYNVTQYDFKPDTIRH